MVKEWSNPFSSFNSMKGLTYYENYKNIVAWMNGEADLCPPVEVNLDPFAECNLMCSFCINQRYLRTHRQEVGEMRKLPVDYIHRLINFLADWGVRGLCISGGGDPSLHEATPGMIYQAVFKDMDCSIFTNAVSLSDELKEAIMECKWVSLSVDAGDFQSYNDIKGRNRFDNVVTNISRLVAAREKAKSEVFLVYKLLILPENADSIYQTCKLAKELGVQAIHIRPADFERSDIVGHKKLVIDVNKVQEQFARCHEIETDEFKVFTVTHKFDWEFHIKHDFKQCLATPLIAPILTDGNCYVCVDKKMEEKFKLGACYPDPEQVLTWWGSDKHRELIKSVNIDDCSRCTISQYNRQIEEVVIKDGMFLSFP